MDDDNNIRKKAEIVLGEDLYGVSLDDLKFRISALEGEIARTKAELSKKSTELSAADALFSPKS